MILGLESVRNNSAYFFCPSLHQTGLHNVAVLTKYYNTRLTFLNLIAERFNFQKIEIALITLEDY